MVAFLTPKRVKWPMGAIGSIGPVLAIAVALIVGAVLALIPAHIIEGIVADSGLPAVLPAAAPPLGTTARVAIALLGSGVAGAAMGFASVLLTGSFGSRQYRAGAPVIRRADAHPDAPPRAPLFATRDLGTPFLDVRAAVVPAQEPLELTVPEPPVFAAAEPAPAPTPMPASDPLPWIVPEPVVNEPAPAQLDPETAGLRLPPVRTERPLPRDLDLPLSAFDPAAVPVEPLPVVRALPLRQLNRPALFDDGDRFETFELTPPVRATHPDPVPAPEPVATLQEPVSEHVAQPAPITTPRTEATIHALLDRLERGVTRRGKPPQPGSSPQFMPARDQGLEDALESLRKLAVSR